MTIYDERQLLVKTQLGSLIIQVVGSVGYVNDDHHQLQVTVTKCTAACFVQPTT